MRAKPFVKPSVVDERVNDPVSQIDVDLTYGTTMNDPSNGGAQRFVGQHRIERKNVLSELLSGIFSPQPRIPSMFEWSLRIIV